MRHWQNDSVTQSLKSFTAGKEYDVIWFCDLVLWPYVKKAFPKHYKLILDRSRVDWLFQAEELRTLEQSWVQKLMRMENIWKVSRIERELIHELDLMIVCGPDDKAFLQSKVGPQDNIWVLPNGANEMFFNASSFPQEPASNPTALFCGALDYVPNIDALQWYAEDIHPQILKARPDYSLTLVGKNPTDAIKAMAHIKGINFVGEVPDVRHYYQNAWFQIVPLRIGGGTRLKIAEGLCLSNPVISTTLGAQGLELRDEEHLLLADESASFAKACLRLISDDSLRRKLGKSGRDKILKSYTWQAIGRRLVEKANSILKQEVTTK
ncbi:glycosyltransferase family 4 protein [Rubellicoccus peritrichatus]|uniref:Glycosyltransferase family 4 protein n=1 Tax=Rubellicoccus peritrichatus TaxID=3080537 RepID=A0AAQ3QVV2_9BACT|nr:glycosyltransferase family 4 protein [Puniceicoccus sp. CR14]WOO42018.1 glycosyltransferase family 4 protein [Puniceicoccus sp. CR14]